ncbi:NB-ARC domain-containing protein [Streptomyces sp. NPDC055134]
MHGLAEDEIRQVAADELRAAFRRAREDRDITYEVLRGLAAVAGGTLTNALKDGPRHKLPALDYLLSIARALEVKESWVRRQAAIADGTTPLAQVASRTLVVGSPLPPLAHNFLSREQAGVMARHLEAGKIVVLAGPGGVGKSQIASSYARSVGPDASRRSAAQSEQQDKREQLDLVVWVDASARSAVLSTYAQAYEDVVAVQGPARNRAPYVKREPADQKAAAEKFVSWLSATERSWLVVLDGVPSPGEVAGLLPDTSPLGRVVVTTRSRDAAWHADSRVEVDVDTFSPEQAWAYLRDALRHPQRRHLDSDGELAELAAALGYLPVGLSHAAAYIVDDDRDIPAYLEDLRDRTLRLADVMPARDGLPDGQSLPLEALWDISLDHADQTHPEGLARPVLHLAALLDGQTGIPEEVFKDKAVVEHLQETLQDKRGEEAAGIRERDVRGALRVLDRLHLMDHQQGLVRVHQLLQWAVREHRTTQAWTDAAVIAAGSALAHVWVQKPDRDELHVRRMLASARELQDNDTDLVLWSREIHAVLFLYGMSLIERGSAPAALAHFTDLRRRAEERLGPLHPSALLARVLVADCRGRAGDPCAAVDDLKEVMSEIRKSSRIDNQVVGHVLHYLAQWQAESAQSADAVTTLTEALDYVEDERQILMIEHDLAVFRCESGDTREADQTFRELIKRKTRLWGEGHPETLASRHERARWRGLRGLRGDTQFAETEMARVFRDRQRVLGPTHPDTLKSQHEAANWRIANGDRAGGMKDLEAVISIRTKHFGPDAPETLLSRLSLASARVHDMTEEAVDSLALAVRDIDRALSEGHPTRLLARRNLKAARKAQRRAPHAGRCTAAPPTSAGLYSMWSQTPTREEDHPDA